MTQWIRQVKDAILDFCKLRKGVIIQFSPCGNCWYADFTPGDQWLRYRRGRTAFPLFYRWTRPIRFVGEDAPVQEPPPRPHEA